MSCTEKNPLTREGTSLLNRVLAALSSGYAKVDEREPADIVLFAKRYAARLKYYEENNTPVGNWQSLMCADVSIPLATLVKMNVGEIIDYKKRIYKRINLAQDDGHAKTQFKFLFDLIFSLAKTVDEQFALLPVDLEFRDILSDVIKTRLAEPLATIQKCFTEFKTAGLLDYTVSELDNDAPIAVDSDENFSQANLSDVWQTPPVSMPITLPVPPPPYTSKELIVYVIHHNLFNAQVELLLNGISSVANRANDLFVQVFDNYPYHTPHFALFIAFIKIYLHARDELNTYTQRHLDFYYKEVLQLINKAPEPDLAHLVFELQKPATGELLLKNTLFKGGKDVTGKEINYELMNDVVLNKAIVAQLCSLQITHDTKYLLKASSVANSDDGQGAKITSADQSWFTFGDVKKIKLAQTGFAIASNVFFLREGDRTITVTVNFKSPLPDLGQYNLQCFTAQFTGAKKWEPISSLATAADASYSQLVFTIHLTPDDPAVIPYSEKIHTAQMNLELPVLRIYLDQSNVDGIPYTSLCSKEITSVDISVHVSGIKDLTLSNDNGTIDASKPFKPFGDFPDTSAGFYIGSKEIFQKQLSQLDITTSWKTPGGGPTLNTQAHYLRQNNFDSNPFNLNTGPSAATIYFSGSNPAFIPTVIDFGKNEKIAADTLEGFLRLRLNEHTYSLDQHLKNISADLSNGTALKWDSASSSYKISIAPTRPPAEIIINDLSVNYTAGTTISFDENAPTGNHLFYHLNPFGFSRVNISLDDSTTEAETTVKTTLLQDIIHEGELFVGLENAEPDTVVTVLFQVAEGSSNPLRDVEQLQWYYLSRNNWKLFKNENIVDNTKNLTQSGVVTFTLSPAITRDNTLLKSGLYWIKVAAHPFADAVCKMILVQAQAARVQLVQDDTKGIEFRQVLPANSISRLVVSDSAIKTIRQPFDSFDGRVRETDDHFYVRVSERLRHKQRAITIWDYEHIILEKFQKIFKVKCINHAGFYTKQGEDVFCENYPGHVSVITIPNENGNTNIDPLRPYTPIGLLNNIHDYLETIISPFVKLHVKNPQFEEIQLDFKVSFYEHLDESFYKKLLNIELERFLCPWAFDNTVEISFGGSIYKSALINFVEERPYVDYVACFKMYQFVNRTDLPQDVEVATASTARSILVSYFDKENDIRHKIVSPATCTC